MKTKFSALITIFTLTLAPIASHAFMFDDFLYGEFDRMDRVSNDSMREVIRLHRQQMNQKQKQSTAQQLNQKKVLSPRIKQLQNEAGKAYWAKDWETHLEIETQLASEGVPSAFTSLGTIYERGLGVKRDINTSFEYYYQAYLLGHKQAKASVLRIAGQLSKEGNIKATKIIGLVHLKNAENEAFRISKNIVNAFSYGYLSGELKRAIEYLTQAYDMGNIESAKIIASIYNSKEKYPDMHDSSKYQSWMEKVKI